MKLPRQLLWSMGGLPKWVQAWVLGLIIVNAAAFAFLHSAVGRWTAAAALVVCVFNIPMMLRQQGLTRLLSLPHFVWFALVAYLATQLFGADPLPAGSVRTYALVVLVVNSISLLFDVIEMVRWLRGEREVLGLRQPKAPPA
ncbi:MAG: hypothetical protein Q8K38_08460 [Burkholderiaceae bacterium]|nr:hypothetical protein [Burkholderiaceae bacterium]MDZ4145479.1 hypothetical protein [Burkholderiales bacterium]